MLLLILGDNQFCVDGDHDDIDDDVDVDIMSMDEVILLVMVFLAGSFVDGGAPGD